MLKRARNLARCLGFELDNNRLDEPRQLEPLLKELAQKSSETIRVFLYDDGSVKLTHQKYAEGINWDMNYIPLEPTWKGMDPALGEITRRFIKTLAENAGIDTIDNMGYFEMLADDFYENIEAEQQLDDEDKYIRSLFLQGSPAMKRLEEYNAIKDPVTPQEIAAYVPKNEKEEKLRQVLLDGFPLLDEKFSLCAHSTIFNKFNDEHDYEEYTSSGFIAGEDLIRVSYSHEMSAAIQELIESDWNCGLMVDEFINIEEIKPEGDTRLDESFNRFGPFLDRLISALYDF